MALNLVLYISFFEEGRDTDDEDMAELPALALNIFFRSFFHVATDTDSESSAL